MLSTSMEDLDKTRRLVGRFPQKTSIPSDPDKTTRLVFPGTKILTKRIKIGNFSTSSRSLNKDKVFAAIGIALTLIFVFIFLFLIRGCTPATNDEKKNETTTIVPLTGETTSIPNIDSEDNATSSGKISPVNTTSPNKATANSIELKEKPQKIIYYLGEKLDLTGLQLLIGYTDGTSRIISEGYTCVAENMSTLGVKNISVKYSDMEVFFSVLVRENKVKSINITKMPNKTSYYSDEAFDATGMQLIATYWDGTEKNISAGYTCEPEFFEDNGNQEIVVSYEGVSTTMAVTVKSDEIQKIELHTMPKKLSYYSGEQIDTTGMQLQLSYSSGRKVLIERGFKCTPAVVSGSGTQTITVECMKKKLTFEVSVRNVTISGISIRTNPSQTEYYHGETLNTNGLTAWITYSNGVSQVLQASACSFYPTQLTTPGKQQITMSYYGYTTTFTVNVRENKLERITLRQLPNRTTFYTGETLTTTGLELTATYSNGLQEVVDNWYTCSPSILNYVGQQKITVNYAGATTTFYVTVLQNSLKSISIEKNPRKMNYFVGEKFNPEGLIIREHYKNGVTKSVDSGFTCSPLELSSAGYQTITVEYKGLKAEFEVVVKWKR